MKLAVIGAYGAGKTTLIGEFTRLTNLPVVHGSPMRDPAGSSVPKSLQGVNHAELTQLLVRRYVERVIGEAKNDDFVSDGSVLHEWVYATIRVAYGLYPDSGISIGLDQGALPGVAPYTELIEHLGNEIVQRAMATYDAFVHLPVEFPLADEAKPISEHFRVLSDELILRTLHKQGAAVHVVTGSLSSRLRALAQIPDRGASSLTSAPTGDR